MIGKLRSLGVRLDDDAVFEGNGDRAGGWVGRPLLARALVRQQVVRSTREAFEKYLSATGAAWVPRRAPSPAEVIALVHRAGGLASLAHPGQMGHDEWIPSMAAAGLDALEVYYPEHSPQITTHYRVLAERLGLSLSGGIRLSRRPGIRPGPGPGRYHCRSRRSRGSSAGWTSRDELGSDTAAPGRRIRSVVKNHGGLRPFRLRELSVEAGEVVAIAGPDEQAAAVLHRPPDRDDAARRGRGRGGRLFDRLASNARRVAGVLERFGLVNARTVLLDQLTIAQNLAIAHTLDVDPMSAETRDRAARMAAEVGIDPSALDQPLSASSALTRFRVRLGRALAHDPPILVIEHPSLGLDARRRAPTPPVSSGASARAGVSRPSW